MSAALTMVACSGGSGAAASSHAAARRGGFESEANNLKFNTAELAVPAGAQFKLFFKNLEGAPHTSSSTANSTASEKGFRG